MEKVKGAILNMFPALSLAVESRGRRTYLVGRGASIDVLAEFRSLIGRERIVNAARRLLRARLMEGRVTFCLNKQVAAVKHVSFCDAEGESPLGPIIVTVESDRLEEIIDWLAPRIVPRQSSRGTSRTIKSSATMVSGKMRRA